MKGIITTMTCKETRSGKYTKKWILETAFRLFNEYGTQSISTKRIAKEMGISPGNLYYHFKNKEDIIRALFNHSCREQNNKRNIKPSPDLQGFLETVKMVGNFWKNGNHFFKRELLILCNKDPELKKYSLESRKETFKRFKTFLYEFATSDCFITPDIPLDTLITTHWMIAENWPNNLEMNNEKLTHKKIATGIGLIIKLWRPYFNEIGKSEVDKFVTTGS